MLLKADTGLPRPRPPRPVADVPVEALLARVEDLAKAWLLELLEQAPLEDAPEILGADMVRDGPRLCDAVVRALADDEDRRRLEPGGALERLASRAGEMAGAADAASSARAIEALRAVIWTAVRDEFVRPGPDQVDALAERLALVAELVRAAVLRRFGGRAPEAPVGPALGVVDALGAAGTAEGSDRSGEPRGEIAASREDQGASSGGIDVSPVKGDASPEELDASPEGLDASPEGRDWSSGEIAASRMGGDASTGEIAASRIGGDASHVREHVSPEGIAGSPEGENGSPEGIAGSPEGEDGSPEGIAGSPEGIDGSTGAEDVLTPVSADSLWRGVLEEEVARAQRSGAKLAVLLAELSDADRVTAAEPAHVAKETFGRFAQAVRSVLRREDTLACETESRAWVIARTTGRAGARALGSRIAEMRPRRSGGRAVARGTADSRDRHRDPRGGRARCGGPDRGGRRVDLRRSLRRRAHHGHPDRDGRESRLR